MLDTELRASLIETTGSRVRRDQQLLLVRPEMRFSSGQSCLSDPHATALSVTWSDLPGDPGVVPGVLIFEDH